MLKKIDILTHADFHGQFREDDENPGLSRLYSAIESVRKCNPQGTLLLDAGDESKCLWHGKAVYEGLDLLKTDAVVLGNHEFDAGREDLEQCIQWGSRHYPILCANVAYQNSNDLINGIKPYVILEREGIHIGILGLTSAYTPYMVEQSAFSDFRMLDSVETIRHYVPLIRKEGAEIIILLTHFPFYLNETGELFECFEQIKDLDVDVFIGGHIPGDYASVKDNCAIVKGGFHGVSLCHVALYFDDKKREVISKKAEIIDVKNGPFGYDERIDAFVKETTKDYEFYFTDVIAEALDDIPMRLSAESPMGDLLSDAMREAAGTDFAYFNCTSCGRMIPKGPLTRYSIQKAISFNEKLQVTKMKGSDLYDLFELIHEPEIFGNNAELMFSGLKIKIDHTRPSGHKVVWIRDLNGIDIEPDVFLSVVTSKYMSTGGNGTRAFAERFKWKELNIKIHDAIADYLQRKGKIKGETDGRYEFIGTPENDNSPW